MRKVAALVVIACCLVVVSAGAQTCPPSDPLCTKDSAGKAKPKLKSTELEDDSKPAEAPPPKASDAAATPATPVPAAKPAYKSDEAPPQRGVITLAEVTITGRVQKPIAAVDVGRISPRLTLSELRQPFLDRIEKAIYSDPF